MNVMQEDIVEYWGAAVNGAWDILVENIDYAGEDREILEEVWKYCRATLRKHGAWTVEKVCTTFSSAVGEDAIWATVPVAFDTLEAAIQEIAKMEKGSWRVRNSDTLKAFVIK